MDSRIRLLAEISMAVAMALVLSQLRLFRMPAGGSVTLAMLPLLVIGLRWGGYPGIMAGVVFGILRLFLGAYVVHPAQFLLDYPVAYGMIGLVGFVPGPRLVAISAAGLGRLMMHVLSGVIFFSGAVVGVDAWVASLIYNVTYLVPEMVLAAAVALPLLNRLPGPGKSRSSIAG